MLGIKHEMEDAFGLPVDLITEEIANPYQFVREGIARDSIVLYQEDREYHGAPQ